MPWLGAAVDGRESELSGEQGADIQYRVQLEVSLERARGALKRIAELEPGSRSAYGKFVSAVEIAKTAL